MPLLGRHKSNQSSPSPPAAAAANNPMAANTSRQQLCDSPLFGIRRQLPTVLDGSNYNDNNNNNLVSQQQKQQSGSGNKQQQLQSVNSSTRSSSAGSDSTGLSSIPQQITRQQIHYAFTIMDSNKDGQVDVRDLSQMLSNLGIPIDEAILSHIMTNTVSKRGDHRISEAEFLDWISHFIQIKSESPPPGSQQKRGTGKTAVRATRSSAAGSSLVAQASEVPRARRGSGSGLALMRSLSSSNAQSPKQQHQQSEQESSSQSCDRNSRSSSAAAAAASTSKGTKKAQLQHQSSNDSIEARNDLKAAFCVFDLDGDGYITVDEVRAGLKLLGESWSPLELRRVFSRCSSNSNCTPTSDISKQRISIDDFVQLLL